MFGNNDEELTDTRKKIIKLKKTNVKYSKDEQHKHQEQHHDKRENDGEANRSRKTVYRRVNQMGEKQKLKLLATTNLQKTTRI